MQIREKSVITNLPNLEHLFTIKNHPIFIGHTIENKENDIYCDLIFDICKDTGIIQIRNLIDPDILYSKYHSEAIGGIWEKHHTLFSDLVSDYINKNNSKSVVEIGGSNGVISNLILNKTNKVNEWIIIDPGKPNELSLNKIVKYKNEVFNGIKKDFDLIIHSHTIEHMFDINEFLEKISISSKEGNYHIFSIPNLYEYMKSNFVNVLNFEHTMFITEDILDILLKNNGFNIIEKKYFLNHSIFYVTQKQNNFSKVEMLNFYDNYKRLFIDYINNIENIIEKFNKKIKESNEDIYLFGAHVFSQFLISNGLKTDKILSILDNSEIKNNKRLYGTDKFIFNPNKIVFKDNSNVILTPSSYREEIIDGLLKINPTINFIE